MITDPIYPRRLQRSKTNNFKNSRENKLHTKEPHLPISGFLNRNVLSQERIGGQKKKKNWGKNVSQEFHNFWKHPSEMEERERCLTQQNLRQFITARPALQ